jgi:hypothetical protein
VDVGGLIDTALPADRQVHENVQERIVLAESWRSN